MFLLGLKVPRERPWWDHLAILLWGKMGSLRPRRDSHRLSHWFQVVLAAFFPILPPPGIEWHQVGMGVEGCMHIS